MPKILEKYIHLFYCNGVLSRIRGIRGEGIFSDIYADWRAQRDSVLAAVPNDQDKDFMERAWVQRGFITALFDTDDDLDWKIVNLRVKRFAESATSPNPIDNSGEEDIFSYIDFLHRKGLESTSKDRVARLEAEIKYLKKENDKYNEKLDKRDRICTTLSFRHVLERLPAHTTKKEKESWEGFWKNAVDKANEGTPSPLSEIVKTYKFGKDTQHPSSQIKSVGAALYSRFSTNIHHFTGVYEVKSDQWDDLDYSILKAITPLAENIQNGDVNWEKERKRFIPDSPTSTSSTLPASSTSTLLG